MTEQQAAQKKNDWLLKIIAVVCAVVLWFYADAEQNPFVTKHFDVPVQYVQQSEDLAVSGGVQTVRVTVRGKETDLSGIRSDDFAATVDLRNALVGSNPYAVQVTAPNLIERYSYQPDKVTLTIDKMQTKEVSVRVRTTGALPAGYDLESTDVLPEKVTVAGLSQVLQTISDVETEAIDLSGMTAETTQDVRLNLPEGVTMPGSERVAVHFLIKVQQNHSSYTAELELRNVPDGMEASLQQSSAVVQISGSAALLENQRELSHIQLFVDCSGLEEGQHTVPIQVQYHGELTIGQFTPSVVEVQLTAAEHSIFEENPFHPNNNNNSNNNNMTNENNDGEENEGDTN